MRTCACGNSIAINLVERNPRKWCTEACRVRHQRKPNEPQERTHCSISWAVCEHCGQTFMARRARPAKACHKPECQRAANAKRQRERGYTRESRKRHGRPPGTVAADHKRRAARKGVETESFHPREIFNRDGWICGICIAAVDPKLVWPDPMSVSLDHVIPISIGGPHTRANVRCSHLTCNTSRGAAMDDEQVLVA